MGLISKHAGTHPARSSAVTRDRNRLDARPLVFRGLVCAVSQNQRRRRPPPRQERAGSVSTGVLAISRGRTWCYRIALAGRGPGWLP